MATPVGRELYITTKERLHDLFPRTVVTLNLRITTNVIMIVHINLKEAAEFATHMGTGPIEQRGLGPSIESLSKTAAKFLHHYRTSLRTKFLMGVWSSINIGERRSSKLSIV